MSQELSILTKDWILDHFANEDLWIANFTKTLHLQEIHYTLEQYIKLKSIKQDLRAEKPMIIFAIVLCVSMQFHRLYIKSLLAKKIP